MSSQFVVVTTDLHDAPTVASEIGIGTSGGASSGAVADAWAYLRTLGNYFANAADGSKSLHVLTQITGVAASGTITLAASAAADTVTVAGTVFTEVASGATGNQFNHGASDTITAANLAAAINASATGIVKYGVVATSSAAVVTIKALVPGYVGNLIGLAISAHGSVSGATLTGGSIGSQGQISAGL